jgi:hypothetical protein
VFSLKNVRRAPGEAGKLKRFTETINETETDFYIQRNGTVSPWPGSIFITVGCFERFGILTDTSCYLVGRVRDSSAVIITVKILYITWKQLCFIWFSILAMF